MHMSGVCGQGEHVSRVRVRGQSGRMGLICVWAVWVGRAVRVVCVCVLGGRVGSAGWRVQYLGTVHRFGPHTTYTNVVYQL